jgi:hypothetical protein
MMTGYQIDYIKHDHCPQQRISCHHDNKIFDKHFEPYQTTYSLAHGLKRGKRAAMCRPEPREASPVPFYGETTYNADYVEKNRSYSPRYGFQRNRSDKYNFIPYGGEVHTTSYRRHYTPKRVDDRRAGFKEHSSEANRFYN